MVANYNRLAILSMITDFYIRPPMISDGWTSGWRSAGPWWISAMSYRERRRTISTVAWAMTSATSRSCWLDSHHD